MPAWYHPRLSTTCWANFWRQEGWSAASYFYLDRPENGLPALAPVAERVG